MASPVVHVIGAGLAGLAAAIKLADGSRNIVIHEAARQAGGRCRSYFDAALGMTIDNGNHLLLSGNHAALAFLAVVGSTGKLVGPPEADFPFVDFASGRRWHVRPNAGPVPWWTLVPSRRVPDTRARDYLALARLIRAGRETPIGAVLDCAGPLYERLWQPFLVAALNTEPPAASAALAGAVVRETLAKGGRACRPLVAAEGLSVAFVEPALRYLAARKTSIGFERRLRGIGLTGDRVARLDFGDATLELGAGDQVILAVPAPVAADLLPGLTTPQTFRAIVNAHFKVVPPAAAPPILGVINATTEWLFAFPDRLSVTISCADRLLDTPREDLAAQIWAEVAELTHIAVPRPAWQIIKEKRATFAATPEEDARRPAARTAHRNLVLAGDWTATGLPATIEGAIRSGNRAAEEILRGT